MVFVPGRGTCDRTKGKPSSNWSRPTGAQVVAFSQGPSRAHIPTESRLTISLHLIHTAYFVSFVSVI